MHAGTPIGGRIAQICGSSSQKSPRRQSFSVECTFLARFARESLARQWPSMRPREPSGHPWIAFDSSHGLPVTPTFERANPPKADPLHRVVDPAARVAIRGTMTHRTLGTLLLA